MNLKNVLILKTLIDDFGVKKSEYSLKYLDDSGPFDQIETLKQLVLLSKAKLLEISSGFGLDYNGYYEDRFLKEYVNLLKNEDFSGAKSFADKANLSIINKVIDRTFTIEDLDNFIKEEDILELNFGQDLIDGLTFSLGINEDQNKKQKNLLYSTLENFRKDDLDSDRNEFIKPLRYKQQRKIFLSKLSEILESSPPKRLSISENDIFGDIETNTSSIKKYNFLGVVLCLEMEGIIKNIVYVNYRYTPLVIDVDEDLLKQKIKEGEIENQKVIIGTGKDILLGKSLKSIHLVTDSLEPKSVIFLVLDKRFECAYKMRGEK